MPLKVRVGLPLKVRIPCTVDPHGCPTDADETNDGTVDVVVVVVDVVVVVVLVVVVVSITERVVAGATEVSEVPEEHAATATIATNMDATGRRRIIRSFCQIAPIAEAVQNPFGRGARLEMNGLSVPLAPRSVGDATNTIEC